MRFDRQKRVYSREETYRMLCVWTGRSKIYNRDYQSDKVLKDLDKAMKLQPNSASEYLE